ncbi:acetate--CoA ligase family protein [Chloroflexota bacterium]
MNEEKFLQLEAIFHPESVAVVGASSDRIKHGGRFFGVLLDSGYEGNIYPVNNTESEVMGEKSYPTVSAIPGPVDYVFAAVPANVILEVIDDCAAKGVKAVHIFTAGFKEAGTRDGRWLEEEIVKKARDANVRIIGPNCIGIYNPSIKLNFWGITHKVGPIAMISQSGGVVTLVTDMVMNRGGGFSKIVSYGNGCDLDSTDFVEYFGADPDTSIIAIYIEGMRNGRRLFELLRQVCMTKPVIICKGGKTEAGAEVIASHTGSLATSEIIWEALSKQTGIVMVDNLEELADTILAFDLLWGFKGRRIGIVCGLTFGGGGEGVSVTDAFSGVGLEVPPFSPETRGKLAAFLPWPGTILRNPLDIGTLGSADIMESSLTTIAADPGVDLIIIFEQSQKMLYMLPEESVQAINRVSIQSKERLPKPIVVVSTPGFPTTKVHWDREQELAAARIPVYPSVQRAARAVARVSQYFAHAGSGEDR